jgi:hypothetical protein
LEVTVVIMEPRYYFSIKVIPPPQPVNGVVRNADPLLRGDGFFAMMAARGRDSRGLPFHP